MPWSVFRRLAFVAIASFAAGCADDPAAPDRVVDPVSSLEAAGPVYGLESEHNVSVGAFHACALDGFGYAWCWGDNAYDQLAAVSPDLCFSEPCSFRPRSVRGGRIYAQIAAGRTHTCGLEWATGDVYCWGTGPLGNGTTGHSARPLRVAASAQFQAVSTGPFHACALSLRGRIWCWGDNDFGQLGSDGPSALVPRLVPGQRQYRMVAVGGLHTCAIDINWNAYCWGLNSTGQVGSSGTPTSVTTPTRVSGEGGWIWISAGAYHTCAVRAGTVWCWGNNGTLQLGSTGGTSFVPRRADVGRGFTRVDAGGYHGCALHQRGYVVCWGMNSTAQLGHGNESLAEGPGRTVDSRNHTSLDAGDYTSCAPRGGRLYCWGGNGFAMLGVPPDSVGTCGSTWPCSKVPIRVNSRVEFGP